MKFTATGTRNGKKVSLTWKNGKIIGGDDVCRALVEGAAEGYEGHMVGPAAGPYTKTKHLKDPVSAFCLIEEAAFQIDNLTGDPLPWPPDEAPTHS